MPSKTEFIGLSEDCSLRLLESPCVYNKATDNLYELDSQALEFLMRCDGSSTFGAVGGEEEFISYCLDEGILCTSETPSRRHVSISEPPSRSLRYLEMHLTGRCNLRCRHCYLGPGTGSDLGLADVLKTMEGFDAMYGLRLLVSGGEPTLHKAFWYINERINDYGFRGILLTNGTSINRQAAQRLKFHEAQVSLDGMKAAHDLLRGDGTFMKAVRGIEHLREAGVAVSVATTVTSVNKDDFDEMQKLIESLGVHEWNVDVPSLSGRFIDNIWLLLPPREAAPYLSYSFGGGYHGGAEGYACGHHLCAVGSMGQVAKCGFYLDSPVGSIKEGLSTCWDRLKPVRLESIDCDCDFKKECRAGCRYRASLYGGEFGPDPVRCHFHGVDFEAMEGGDEHVDKEGREGERQHL